MRPAIWSTFWMSLGLSPNAASELFGVCNCAATVRAPGDAALAAFADDALAVVIAAVAVGCASEAIAVAAFTLEAAAPFAALVAAVVTVLLLPLAAAGADAPSVVALALPPLSSQPLPRSAKAQRTPWEQAQPRARRRNSSATRRLAPTMNRPPARTARIAQG
jgi:hypothetical protein